MDKISTATVFILAVGWCFTSYNLSRLSDRLDILQERHNTLQRHSIVTSDLTTELGKRYLHERGICVE